MRLTARLIAGLLASLSALHLAWAFGSAFPFRSRRALADAVVGTPAVPSPAACVAVAGALAVGAAVVGDVLPTRPATRRYALRGMAALFAVRGSLGFLAKTELVSPGSNSTRFIRLDRRVYAPLCIALSLGCLSVSKE